MENDLENKLNILKDYLKSLKRAVIAFSSGVDSAFLLKTAHDLLGENVIAITISSCFFPERELNQSISFCKANNIKQIIVEYNQLDIEGIKHNPKNRCYLCKKEMFGKICEIAENNGFKYILEGSNKDDENDFRPGFKAIEELGIKSPLLYAGLTKNDIRILSKRKNLPTWNKPSFACLATRFEYGEEITREKLNRIDKSEQLLFDLGFTQVRVRMHGNIARIEILPDEFDKLLLNRNEISSKLKELDFTYVTMDLTGYKTGSMNKSAI